MARLWLPEGLYLQELCDFVRPTDSGRAFDVDEWARLLALRNFQPQARTIYVTCRDAESHPRGRIVDRAFHAPGPGRAALSQVLRHGKYVLHCGNYEVKRLPVYRNLDVLTRAGHFMSAAIQLLNIEIPRAQCQNLAPLKALLQWWRDPCKRLDVHPTDWDGIDPWIHQEFDDRDRELDKARDPGNSKAGQLVASPVCYANLERELRFAPDLAKATWRTARAFERPGGASTASAEAVDDAIEGCILSAFRNAAQWSQRSLDESLAEPNWFGFPLAHTRSLVKRAFAALDGRPKSPQLPVKAARKMVAALKPAPSLHTLEDAVSAYVDGRVAGANPKVNQKCERYFDDKHRFALGKYYLVLQSLRTFIQNSPSPDQRRSALLGLLRAIDASVWQPGKGPTGVIGRNQAGDFVQRAKDFIQDHLLVEAPESKHHWDQSLLDALELEFPTETHRRPPPRPDESGRPPADPLRAEEITDALQSLIAAANLDSTERQAILHKYGIEHVQPNLSQIQLKNAERRAFEKLRKVSRGFAGGATLF